MYNSGENIYLVEGDWNSGFNDTGHNPNGDKLQIYHLHSSADSTTGGDMANCQIPNQDQDFDNIPDFKAQVGFSTSFNVSSGEREFSHTWEVTEVVPGGKITYDWTFGNYPGRGATTFELSSRDGQTTLTLTNTVAEDFPDGVPEFERESCLGGWQYFIGTRLKEYLRSSVNQSYLLSRGTMEPSGWDRSFRSPGCPNP